MKADDGSDRAMGGRTTTSRKIAANQRNALKSTGPITARGKSHSRYNALRHGGFAKARLLPGENRAEFEDLARRVASEERPHTAIEEMLVEQIIGDMWRLRRVELAEHAYFDEIRKAAFAKAKRPSADSETAGSLLAAAIGHGDDGNQMSRPKWNCVVSCPPFKAEKIDASPRSVTPANGSRGQGYWLVQDTRVELGKLILDGTVDPSGAFPYSSFDSVRRALVRSILKKNQKLAEIRSWSFVRNCP